MTSEVVITIASVVVGALLGSTIILANVKLLGKAIVKAIPGNSLEPNVSKFLRLLADEIDAANGNPTS